MFFIPSIPVIRSINERLNISFLQHNIVLIDILNAHGKRIYVRVNLDTLKSIRKRKIYNSLVDGAKVNISEEGEIATVHRWNISFGKKINYAYEILFNCLMSPTENQNNE